MLLEALDQVGNGFRFTRTAWRPTFELIGGERFHSFGKVLGFNLNDTDVVRIAGFDEFFINFQVSSLFRRAWTFDEVSINGPYFLFERYTSEDNRLSRLLEDLPKEPA